MSQIPPASDDVVGRPDPVSPRSPLLPWAERLSLRARLLAVVAALLALALVGAGSLTVANLRGQLVAQVDDQLRSVTTEKQALNRLVGQLRRDESSPFGEDPLPSRYVVRVWFDDEETPDSPALYDGEPDRLPDLPELSYDQAEAAEGQFRTVEGSGGSRWRMVAVPVVYQPGGQPAGAAVIALPLDDVQATLKAVALRFVLLGTALVAALVLIGFFLIGRAFRPLREVQSVTTAFGSDASRTRSSGGSGLGLAIVDAIVRAHGGLALVHPTPGSGATFEVRLPRVPQGAQPSAHDDVVDVTPDATRCPAGTPSAFPGSAQGPRRPVPLSRGVPADGAGRASRRR